MRPRAPTLNHGAAPDLPRPRAAPAAMRQDDECHGQEGESRVIRPHARARGRSSTCPPYLRFGGFA